jgi:NAD(P)-dependent dehydrogenase (short-subunit alcohol dehydrogenase family)
MSKVALVTGGGKRLGRAICLSLAERGYDIAVHYNHSDKEARETSEAVKKSGRNSAIFKSDLSDWRASRDLVRSVVKTFPSCSVLVNSASVFEDVGFPDVTEEQFDRDFNVNFKSPFFLSQQFSKESRAGHIINLLDTRVSQIETAHFVYNLTKKALKDFTLMAAKALGPEIRVNAICPGPILPPPGKDESYLEKISGDTPLGVPGKPEYIVTALNYILDNPYVTGECLYVDGGQHLM